MVSRQDGGFHSNRRGKRLDLLFGSGIQAHIQTFAQGRRLTRAVS